MHTIWIVNHFAITPDLPGGSRHFDFSVELVKHGHPVSIFASDFSYLHRKYYKLSNKQLFLIEKNNGINFVWVKASPYEENNLQRVFNMLSFSINFLRVAFKLPKPDIIIGSSPHLFAALAGYILSKIRGAKFVLEIRDLWPQVLVDMGKAKENSFLIKVLRNIERFLYRKSDKIIVLAQGSIQYLEKYGIPRSKIVFIPNGVNFEQIKPTLDRKQARQKYQFNKFTLVYTGAHGPANALGTILLAAEKLGAQNNIEFVLLGDGPDKDKLKEFAFKQNINNVRFLDPISKREMPDFLLAADVGIITLGKVDLFSYGVSPNKLFHYMGSGLPVICAVGGDMGRMVEDAGAGMSIVPENGEIMAQVVNELYQMDPLKRTQLGKNGRNYVAKYYTSEKQVEKIEGILKELCELDH